MPVFSKPLPIQNPNAASESAVYAGHTHPTRQRVRTVKGSLYGIFFVIYDISPLSIT